MNRRQVLLTLCAVPVIAYAQTDASPASAQQQVTVYKTATCGCCKLWVDHLQKAGFKVQTHDLEDLSPVKERMGVPASLASCHTAEVGGYFIEGHVPAQDVKRLLRERPDARGLTVPGMPIGSPGMESPSGKVQPYEVLLIAKDGKPSVYARHGQ